MRKFASIFFLFWTAFANQISIDPDGGYKGIVVKIDENVPETNCPQLLQKIQVLFRNSSQILYQALEQKAYFKSISIVIPNSWRDSKCQKIIRLPSKMSYRKSHIKIVQNPLLHQIYTEQSGKCGQSGNGIFMPLDIELNPKIFVKEWSKLRYGIFDEIGFTQDLMYPREFVHSNGRLMPTGASNSILSWNSSHDQIQQVTCSLAHQPTWPNVKQFCKDEEIAIQGPTKHNVLCEGKSAYQIINSHADFAQKKQILAQDIMPKFEIVREPQVKFLLLLETSVQEEEWKWVNKAAQKLIRFDLPLNSNLAIWTFNNETKTEHNMVQVHSDQIRARLADTIPDKYHLSSAKSCVFCALKKVINDVGIGTNIILVTKSQLNEQEAEKLKKSLLESNTKLDVIFTSHNVSMPKIYQDLTHFNEGQIYMVPHFSSMDFFVNLNEAFSDILQREFPLESNYKIHENKVENLSLRSTGQFQIDVNLGQNTQFSIFVEDEEDHLIRSISFQDSQGQKFGPFSRMSSDFDLVNLKTINFPAGKSPPFNEQIGMSWQYSIEWHDTKTVRKSIVMVTSKPRSQSDLIRAKSWTHSQILYLKLLKGQSPIIGAKISAKIIKINGDQVAQIGLDDNGFGDPDIMEGDGIYSAYIGRSVPSGLYTSIIEIDSQDGYFVTQTISDQLCCGSSTLPLIKSTEKTGFFKRTIIGPLIEFKLNSSQDQTPPSKIGDLKISQISADRLLAEWSAPGGDFNAGSVASYRFVFASDIQDLIDPIKGQPEVLIGFDRIEKFGTKSKFDFNFAHYDQDFYVGLYAFDLAGNRGKISNLVHVRIDSPASVQVQIIQDEFVQDSQQENWIIIGSICGLLLVLFLVSLAIFVLIKKKSKQEIQVESKQGSTTSTNLDETDCSSFDSELKIERKIEENVTPVYWSASQLLNKLDQQKQNYFYQNPPEEYTITVNGTYDVSQCLNHHHRIVIPKPRNITQV